MNHHHHHLLRSRSLLFALLSLSLILSFSFGEDDTRCLQGVKNSFTDPHDKLSSWIFSNISAGAICNFVGVECWNDRENRLISLELRNFGLTGTITDSLQFCRSLQSLDLSGNSLCGSIPDNICVWLPYLVTLDFSQNSITSQIPDQLANCSFLNNLVLDNNKLSGSIPHQLSSMRWLKKLSVANNDLSGRVPSFDNQLDVNYDGNNGLCGEPLEECGGSSKKSFTLIIVAGFSGAAASMLLLFGLWRWYFRGTLF